MDWKVYYGDGSTYSSDEPVENAPCLNFQAAGNADERVGRFVVSRYDYYWLEDGRWWGGDIFGLFDYLSRPGWKKVGFGRSLSNADFQKVMEVAINDPDLPSKSAWDERENIVEGVNL